MPNFDTLFLDRDGVINKKLEGKYVRNFSEFEFMPGALDSISKLSNLFSRILIVTNQQGIAKGIMSEADLNILHTKMQDRIEKLGGKINKIYYCPHLQDMDCICRKPKSGMIEQAIIDFPEINIENSYLIGDSDSDIKAGKKMNLNTVKVDNDYTLAKWT
ncbi:MAG: HAD family hydrolase, partial [Pelagibacterales bacterium]|nr:HAD family hydrolase [Pelagibacterales bacterium]